MQFDKIVENPYENGRLCANNNMSIHANPFRNHEGYAQEFCEWERGWNAVHAEKVTDGAEYQNATSICH